MRIDAHQHFWDLNQPFQYDWLKTPQHRPICRSFLPIDLHPQMQSAGIDYSVFVQTQHHLDENRWGLNLADKFPFIAGVVGWVDLQSENCERDLQEFIAHPKFVGVRHITQDEPDDDFIIRPQVLRGLKILEKHLVPFDLLFYVKHLKHAATVARAVPDLPLIIDHLAKPRIKDQSFDDWRPHLKAAAECRNVYCKLSGMVTEADWQSWKPADLKPYVQTALDYFGVDRCLFGSDWPVCELAGSYQQVVQSLEAALSGLSPSESAKIWGENAAVFYKLKF